jgi:YD repeat-containing protein
VWSDEGTAVDYPPLGPGQAVVGRWGWELAREKDGYLLRTADGLVRRFPLGAEEAVRLPLGSVEDRNGNRIELVRDAGRLARIVDSVGRIVHVGAAPGGRIASLGVETTDAQGRSQLTPVASYRYDASGDLVQALDAEGNGWAFRYDERHRLLAHTDRCGLTFHFVYDAEGRCVESWGAWPGGPDPSLAPGLPELLADGTTPARGVHQVRITFGPDGYREVADSTQVRRYFGNGFGTVDKLVEGGSVTSFRYDELGNIVARQDPEGGITRYERDARGRPLAETDPLGRVTRVERDSYGLPLRVVDPAGGGVGRGQGRAFHGGA